MDWHIAKQQADDLFLSSLGWSQIARSKFDFHCGNIVCECKIFQNIICKIFCLQFYSAFYFGWIISFIQDSQRASGKLLKGLLMLKQAKLTLNLKKYILFQEQLK